MCQFFEIKPICKEGELFYWFTFKYAENKKVIKTINLECSDILAESGASFIIGIDKGNTHSTLSTTYKKMPDYEELKEMVISIHTNPDAHQPVTTLDRSNLEITVSTD